jgi:ABC-type lipoprotein export system ATPase subunit
MALIQLVDLHRTFKLGTVDLHVLKGVSTSIHKGELVYLMGPSGSGKSTLMNIIGCLDKPSSGEYFLAGENVTQLSSDELAFIRNQKIGFVFQNFNLLPRISALENVALPLRYGRHSIQEHDARQQAKSLLERVGLGERINHDPSQLSGGEQQRVAIARALINKPELILADEPTGNLDSKNSSDILNMFRQLNQEDNITILLVTHENDITEITSRTIFMQDGQIID